MDQHRHHGHVGGLALTVQGVTGPSAALLVRDPDGQLVLRTEDASAYTRLRPSREVRRATAAMAERGVTVRVEHDGRAVVTLGVARAPWWQSTLTGSRHVRVESWRAARSARTAGSARPAGGARPAVDGTTPAGIGPVDLPLRGVVA